MKTKKHIIFVFLLISVVSSLLIINGKVEQKEQLKEGYSSIPSFQLSDIQGNIISDKTLPPKKMILFLFFDPECEGCKEEFEQLKIYRDSLLDCQIIFVTTQTKTITTVFLQQIDFHMQENMLILRDTNADLAQKMDVNIVPSTLIYDINRKLINRYVGQVNMEILTKYMSK